MAIVNDFNFGLACKYDDIEVLSENIEAMMNRDKLKEYEKSVLDKKLEFSMKEKIKEVDKADQYFIFIVSPAKSKICKTDKIFSKL